MNNKQDHPAQSSGGAKDVDPDELAMAIVLSYDQAGHTHPTRLIQQLAIRGMRIVPLRPSPPEAAVEALKQIAIVCENNASVGNTALALKFVHEVADQAIAAYAVDRRAR